MIFYTPDLFVSISFKLTENISISFYINNVYLSSKSKDYNKGPKITKKDKSIYKTIISSFKT